MSERTVVTFPGSPADQAKVMRDLADRCERGEVRCVFAAAIIEGGDADGDIAVWYGSRKTSGLERLGLVAHVLRELDVREH